MLSAARVVGNMVRIAGATLGDPFFTKEIDQALQMLEGGHWQNTLLGERSSLIRLPSGSRALQRCIDSAPVRFECTRSILPVCAACAGQDLDTSTRLEGRSI